MGRRTTDRTGRVAELLVSRERRLTGLVHRHVVWREDRQLIIRHGHDPAVRAVDDRNRSAPEPLARDQPVAEAVVHLDDTARVFSEELRRAKLRLHYLTPIQESGVDLDR